MDTVWAPRWCNAHEAQRVDRGRWARGETRTSLLGPNGLPGCSALRRCHCVSQFSTNLSELPRSLSWRRARYKQRLLFWVILWKNELSCFSPAFANTLANSRSTCIYRNCDLRSSSSKGCRFPPPWQFLLFVTPELPSSCRNTDILIESLLCVAHYCLRLIFGLPSPCLWEVLVLLRLWS